MSRYVGRYLGKRDVEESGSRSGMSPRMSTRN